MGGRRVREEEEKEENVKEKKRGEGGYAVSSIVGLSTSLTQSITYICTCMQVLRPAIPSFTQQVTKLHFVLAHSLEKTCK